MSEENNEDGGARVFALWYADVQQHTGGLFADRMRAAAEHGIAAPYLHETAFASIMTEAQAYAARTFAALLDSARHDGSITAAEAIRRVAERWPDRHLSITLSHDPPRFQASAERKPIEWGSMRVVPADEPHGHGHGPTVAAAVEALLSWKPDEDDSSPERRDASRSQTRETHRDSRWRALSRSITAADRLWLWENWDDCEGRTTVLPSGIVCHIAPHPWQARSDDHSPACNLCGNDPGHSRHSPRTP